MSSLFSRSQRIRTEIVGGAFPQRKNLIVKGNHIVVQKATNKTAEITATFDNTCLVPYNFGLPPFRVVKYYLILKDGASRCVSFAGDKDIIAPSCTKEEIRQYAQATAIKGAGNTKPENKTLIYLLIFVNIALTALTLLLATGKVTI